MNLVEKEVKRREASIKAFREAAEGAVNWYVASFDEESPQARIEARDNCREWLRRLGKMSLLE